MFKISNKYRHRFLKVFSIALISQAIYGVTNLVRAGDVTDAYGPQPPAGYVARFKNWVVKMFESVTEKKQITQSVDSTVVSNPQTNPAEQNPTSQTPNNFVFQPVARNIDSVVKTVEAQPAVTISQSGYTVKTVPVPGYSLKTKKPLILVEKTIGLEKVVPITKKSLRAASFALPKEPELPTAQMKINLKLWPLPQADLARLEIIPDDGFVLIRSLFSWLFGRDEEAIKSLHGLAVKTPSQVLKSKSLAFMGWILEENGFNPLASLMFSQALSFSPMNEAITKYDEAVTLSLGSMVRESLTAKSWFKPQALERLSEHRLLKPEIKGFYELLIAERAFDQKSYATARKRAQSVSDKSQWKEQARFLAALSLIAQNEKRETYELAGRELTELFRKVEDPVVFDATALALGRTHFILGNYKAAHQYLSQVSRDTNMFIESAVDNGWALLRSGDRNHAVGNMFTLQTAYFQGAYMPDTQFIQSLGYQEICQFGDALTAVKNFKMRYAEAFNKLTALNAGGKKPENTYYDEVVAYLSKKDHEIPDIIARELGRHPDFLKKQKALNLISRDEKTLGIKFPAYASQLSTWMSPSINELRADFHKHIGRFLKQKALALEEDLKFLTANMSLLEYEIFAGAGKNLALQGAQNFAVDEKQAAPQAVQYEQGKEYWPYEDEIWEDELNNFRSKMVNACAKVAKQ